MGAVRYRAGLDRGRACRLGLPDARRCAGRCGTLGAAGGGTRGGGDLSERACARDLAEFRGRMGARILHAAASCVLGPVIAAISLGLVGHAALGARLGRNARFASVGNGVAAAAMGACGYLVSSQAVFFLTAILAAPAILALGRIRMSDVERPTHTSKGTATASLRSVLCDRRLLIFAGCILLFQLANAAMLPIMGSILTMRSSAWASTLIGACIVVPTVIVAGVAPWVGRQADAWGRRPLLLLCFAALALRGVFFALVSSPYLIVAVQILDGVCAAVLGVVLPLVVADVMRGTGRFNLGLAL